MILVVAGVGLHSCHQDRTPSDGKPNVVFILADDMGYGDPGCYNKESRISTPHIDRLAARGIMFTDAHASGAWCVPSRYGLITGRYPRGMELNPGQRSLIEQGQETVATLMKRNGYRTACIGKWHLGFDDTDFDNPSTVSELKGGPVEKGFDYFFGMHASLDIPPYFYIENDRAVCSPTGFIDARSSPDATSEVSGAFYRAGAISPDFKHEEVLDRFLGKADTFLTGHVTHHGDKPFFLYFALTAPHTPWLPKDEFAGKSGAGEYGDFVMQVDYLVGRLIARLDQAGLLENTIIFFSSDNGPVWFREDVEKYGHRSTGGLRGKKSDMWEGGSRMPFIVSYPSGFASGAISSQMIAFTDVMATLADLVNDEDFNQEDFDSRSFLPVLLDPGYDRAVRPDLVVEKKVYREGAWKFIDGWGQGGIELNYAPHSVEIKDIPGELYDLETDTGEKNNLYDRYPERVSKMRGDLHEILGNQE